MALNTALLAELKHEASNTRKMLERVPSDNLQWKPHEKSFSIGYLASHIANIPVWAGRIIEADEFDFAKSDFTTPQGVSATDIVEKFDKNLADAIKILEETSDDVLNNPWSMRNGEHVFFTTPKKVSLRNFLLNHAVHRRGQLSVYLRLLDIAVPGMYGPSADER